MASSVPSQTLVRTEFGSVRPKTSRTCCLAYHNKMSRSLIRTVRTAVLFYEGENKLSEALKANDVHADALS